MPATDIHEASVLMDRARRLVEPHAERVPALRYFVRTLVPDARCLSNIARHVRESDGFVQRRLFA